MTQYEFDKLLEKYLQGGCSTDEESLLDEWANKQLEHETTVLTEVETKAVKKQLWKRIKHSTFRIAPLSMRWFSWTKLGMAASLLFVVSMSLLWYKGFDNTLNIFNERPKSEAAGVEMTNTTDKSQNITLNDGSVVSLQPNSSLTFYEKFGDSNRVVFLKGEGFFKVKRDTTKPFYVYAGDLVTEVLGTSFTVKSYENDKTSEVIVVSGKVKVYNKVKENANIKGVTPKEVKQTILTPNQKIVFDKTTQQIRPQLVDQPIALNPPKSPVSFIFQEVSLFDVLDKLERVYGLEIIPNPSLKNCIFTGDLNGLDLYTQLDLICKTTNATFEKHEAKIIVTGEGCH